MLDGERNVIVRVLDITCSKKRTKNMTLRTDPDQDETAIFQQPLYVCNCAPVTHELHPIFVIHPETLKISCFL